MIKSRYVILLINLLVVFIMQACAETNSTKVLARIKMTMANQAIFIDLFDNSASRQLLSQLPVSIELSDFAGTEKIAYLPKKLAIQATPTAKDVKSDFTYYAPWGNLALFYKDYAQSSNVYALGIIKTGKEQLSLLKQNITITLERID